MWNKLIKTYTLILVLLGITNLLTIPSLYLDSPVYLKIAIIFSLPEPIVLLLSIIIFVFVLAKKMNKYFLILPSVDIIGTIISITFLVLKINIGSNLVDILKYVIFIIFGIYFIRKSNLFNIKNNDLTTAKSSNQRNWGFALIFGPFILIFLTIIGLEIINIIFGDSGHGLILTIIDYALTSIGAIAGFLIPFCLVIGIRKLHHSKQEPGISDNRSGLGGKSIIPKEIKRWNWGAAGLPIIWGLYHGVWISLLSYVPIFGWMWVVVMGIKGNEWAWKKNKWQSVKAFKESQKKWKIVGIIFMVISFVLFVIVLVDIVAELTRTGEKLKNEIKAAVVSIYCPYEDQKFNLDVKKMSGGSGVILLEDGTILTNAHILPQNDNKYLIHEKGCFVMMPNPKTGEYVDIYTATPRLNEGWGDWYDIAYLKIDGVFEDKEGKHGEFPRKFPNIANIKVCNIVDLNLGDPVMILGYPEIGGGSNLIITEGVISGFYTKDKYILTSAQISGGNSGGLALSNGCYIGIPAYQYTEEDGSLGEIISIDLIQEFVDSLKKPFDAEKLKAEQ